MAQPWHIIGYRKGATDRRLPLKNNWLRNNRSFSQDGAVISFCRETEKSVQQRRSVQDKR